MKYINTEISETIETLQVLLKCLKAKMKTYFKGHSKLQNNGKHFI